MARIFPLGFVALFFIVPTCQGANGVEQASFMDQIESCKLDSAVFNPAGITIDSEDFSLRIDSGLCSWFEPILIDSVHHKFGLYFSGTGVLQFAPKAKVERGQLHRFFKSGTLNRVCTEAVIFMSDSLTEAVQTMLGASGIDPGKRAERAAEKLREDLTDRSDRKHVYALLRSLLHPRTNQFITVYANLVDGGKVCYTFDPWKREEISFQKKYKPVGGRDFLENVCSYATGAEGISTGFNGVAKDRIQIVSYDIDASISNKGIFVGKEQVTFVPQTSCSDINFMLHPGLEVDSVVDQSGKALAFRRYHDLFDYWFYSLYIFWDEEFAAGDTIRATVYSHGKIAERDLSVFYVTASSSWYPEYSDWHPATFVMRFKTPKNLAFVATGEMTRSEIVKDTLISTWEVRKPTSQVSFTIGFMEKYEFPDTMIGQLDVYYSEDLHRAIGVLYGEALVAVGSHMERQVGNDVLNALRLFTDRFGPLETRRFSVSETFLSFSQAYLGFIHLGFNTWINTDAWGKDRMHRAHEAAHQWWGTGVDHETYHDQWLSEGLSEYSGYLYLQAVAGNDMFLDRLKEARKEIVAAREKPSDSSSATGPMIIGSRSSSTESENSWTLMIYDKGAFVVHMLRNMLIDWRKMDETQFFAMMREYYQTYKGSTASTADFQRIVEKYMGEDMTWFFDQWVYGTEIPTYKFSYTIEPGQKNDFVAKCHIVTEGVSPGFKMYVPMEIDIDGKRKAYVSITIDKPDYTFDLPGLPMNPKKLRLNPFESVLAEVKQ